VTTQLLLLEGGKTVRHLDSRTRKLGLKGIAEARRRLAEVTPPVPSEHGRLSRAS
jgi:hypothetical protein